MNTFTTSPSNRQAGMTLIEVVVAIVVLAIGALGVAGLQARALKGNESSLQRTQAVIAANSLIDAMHASVVPRNSTAMICNGGAGFFITWLGDLQANLGAGQLRTDHLRCQRQPARKHALRRHGAME